MDEPRWILEVPLPGSDASVSLKFDSGESARMETVMFHYAAAQPNIDTILIWNW